MIDKYENIDREYDDAFNGELQKTPEAIREYIKSLEFGLDFWYKGDRSIEYYIGYLKTCAIDSANLL